MNSFPLCNFVQMFVTVTCAAVLISYFDTKTYAVGLQLCVVIYGKSSRWIWTAAPILTNLLSLQHSVLHLCSTELISTHKFHNVGQLQYLIQLYSVFLTLNEHCGSVIKSDISNAVLFESGSQYLSCYQITGHGLMAENDLQQESNATI